MIDYLKLTLALGLCVAAASCVLHRDTAATAVIGEAMVTTAYPGMPERLTQRAIQDEQQRLCSRQASHALSSDDAAVIVQAARASMKYPDSGKLSGDWKRGEQLVLNAAGMRVREGRVEKVAQNGALCINCHALDPKNVNAGNLGPALTGYAAQRGSSPETIKYTYEKIYNSWAFYPCSNMPRLGHNGFLTPDQIAHVVAYLVDPESPVNRK